MTAPRIKTEELEAYLGSVVTIKGHAQTVRDMGNLIFISVRDAAGAAQVVIDKPDLVKLARAISPEQPLVVEGEVVESPQKNSKVEVLAQIIAPQSQAGDPLPVEISKASKMDALSLTTMLDYRPLTLRNPKMRAIFKIEAAICRAFRQFLENQGFAEIHSPKIVSTGTEGGAQLFQLNYFGRPAFLAQSPQFYKQIMVGVFERVFEIGPVYRAEEHDTTRHLNEYVSMDFEMGFIESEQDIIAMQIRLMRHVFADLKESCKGELALFGASVPEFETLPQILLKDAQELLLSKLGWRPKAEPSDLDPEGERLLCNHMLKEHGVDLVYVTHYPHALRPFYAMPEAQSNSTAAKSSRSFDLLFRGLEITTGGQRINEYAQLIASIEERSLDPANFADYLQCFKYGMPPHGGLAIGLERLAKQLLGLPTVKLAALFPRDLNRLTP